MHKLTIYGGNDKYGNPEGIQRLDLFRGELYTIVGNTGSGKSRLIKDIEQLANHDTITQRSVFIDDKNFSWEERQERSLHFVAHLGQNMRFMLDTTVKDFLNLHARCRAKQINSDELICQANQITPEAIMPNQSLNLLSGGQTRALMIADIACICDSPIVLIDEIENAGIDKEKAFALLLSKEKLVMIVTHDPHTAFMAKQRIVMEAGAINQVIQRSKTEEETFHQLSKEYRKQKNLQDAIRNGACF